MKPFKIYDEWYYNMRFQPDHVTPILSAVPPDSATHGSDPAHSGDPEALKAHKGMPHHVAWAYERPDGGRGFGFTGGHFHTNWGNENFRKTMLNAILWIAKAEVPANGVQSVVTQEDLEKNLDPKGQRNQARAKKPKADRIHAVDHTYGPEAAPGIAQAFHRGRRLGSHAVCLRTHGAQSDGHGR